MPGSVSQMRCRRSASGAVSSATTGTRSKSVLDKAVRSLLQRGEEAANVIELGAGKIDPRHGRARLDALRTGDPGGQVPDFVGQDAGGQGPGAHQMAEIGPDGAARQCAAHRVARAA